MKLWSKISLPKFPFMLRRIEGHSMNPTYEHGQLIVVWRNRSPKRDDVVIARITDNFEVIKRVVDVRYGLVYLEGDNKGHTKKYAVRPDEIIGVLS